MVNRRVKVEVKFKSADNTSPEYDSLSCNELFFSQVHLGDWRFASDVEREEMLATLKSKMMVEIDRFMFRQMLVLKERLDKWSERKGEVPNGL